MPAAGYAEQRAYDGTRAPEPSLRQLVESFAQEAGVEFLPKAGRRHEGLQVICCKSPSQTAVGGLLVCCVHCLYMHREATLSYSLALALPSCCFAFYLDLVADG